jgi:hypothetical protein
MKKKLFALFMACILVFGLAACKSSASSTSGENSTEATPTSGASATDATTEGATTDTATTEVYPEEKVLIGVELYDPTESETLAIQSYFDYLSQNFNVEFKYSEAIADADGEMKFIEDCAMAGCKAFFGYYNVTGTEQISKVLEYGMYYYGRVDDASFDTYKKDPLYLGYVVAGGDEYEKGEALGKWVVEQGYNNVVYANGGADFGVQQFVQRQAGFMDAVGTDVDVTVVSGFPNDQFFADQAAALSKEGLQAVVASFNGLDFWAQPIASAGLNDVKLATIGAVNDPYVDGFASGAVDYLVSSNLNGYGLGVAIMLNAVDGNADAIENSGVAIDYNVPTWFIDNADDCKKLNDILNGSKVYSADDLRSLIVKLNPDANYQTVVDLADAGALEKVLSK